MEGSKKIDDSSVNGEGKISPKRLTIKVILLFICINAICFVLFPLIQPGKISFYNHIFPGRLRFPFGEHPERSYNFSLFDLDAMFASHIISGRTPKDPGEYRVLLVGDSSVWGTLLKPDETLAGYLNQVEPMTCESKRVVFYNLGYPTISLSKDLIIIEQSLKYQPDMIIWLTTLEAYPADKQLSPIVANNRDLIKRLAQEYNLNLNLDDSDNENILFWKRTIPGDRRALADIMRLQIYGVLWAATGIDQEYPVDYVRAQHDLDADIKYYDWTPENFDVERLSWDVLKAGVQIARDHNVGIILVNEPIMISSGLNSDLRYNFFYPRWVYDGFRQRLAQFVSENKLDYLDLWKLVPEAEFTNSAIHLTPFGSKLLASKIREQIKEYHCE